MQPNYTPASAHWNNGSLPNGVNLVSSASIEPLPIEFIWQNNLAAGKFQILAGQPGTGKTTLAIEMAAILSNGGLGGRCWPDQAFAPQGDTVFWSGEDHAADTLVPRLMAAGANMSWVHLIDGTVEHGRRRAFDIKKDIGKLSEALYNLPNPKLIVIDSIIQAVSGDSNKNSEVRRGLAPLIELAERHRCAILGITHVNKSSKGKEPIDRVTGSLAYVAVARVVMFAARIHSGSESGIPTCALIRAKSNIGSSDGGFEYQIEPTTMAARTGLLQSSKIRWGEVLHGSAKEILKYAEGDTATEKTGAVEAAADFLISILSSGDLTYPEIEEKAKEAKISKASLIRAKATLKIESRKQCGFGPASPQIWHLPSQQNDPSFGNIRTVKTAFNTQPTPIFNPQHFEAYTQPASAMPMNAGYSGYGAFDQMQPDQRPLPMNEQVFGQAQHFQVQSMAASVASVASVESVESVETAALPESTKPGHDNELVRVYADAYAKRFGLKTEPTTQIEPPDAGVASGVSSFNDDDDYGDDDEDDEDDSISVTVTSDDDQEVDDDDE